MGYYPTQASMPLTCQNTLPMNSGILQINQIQDTIIKEGNKGRTLQTITVYL